METYKAKVKLTDSGGYVLIFPDVVLNNGDILEHPSDYWNWEDGEEIEFTVRRAKIDMGFKKCLVKECSITYPDVGQVYVLCDEHHDAVFRGEKLTVEVDAEFLEWRGFDGSVGNESPGEGPEDS